MKWIYINIYIYDVIPIISNIQKVIHYLQNRTTYVSGISCCHRSNQEMELKFDSNLEQVWNTEFSSDNINLGEEQNLFTLSDGFYFVEFYIQDSDIGYDCYIQDDEGYNLDILGLEMGNFHQIFIKLQSDGV